MPLEDDSNSKDVFDPRYIDGKDTEKPRTQPRAHLR